MNPYTQPTVLNRQQSFFFQIFSLLTAILISGSAVDSSSAQSFPAVSPEDAGFSSERLERLTSTLSDYTEQGRLSGGVVLVTRGGEAVYFESFGNRDIEKGSVMRKDDIFRIASQTKAIVSAGIMQLQERGELLISDPVSKYLPEFEHIGVAEEREDGSYEIVEADRPVTIRHLLTHTSGIDYGNGIASDLWEEAGIRGWYFADRDETVRETVARMAELPFQHHPGEDYTYGYSTDILGAVIEVITGETLEEYLDRHILEPLKMNDTHFYLPESKKERLAAVYSATAGSNIERAPDPGGAAGQGHYVEGPRKAHSGGAGLLSTAADYGRFLQMMLNGGELDGVRILSPKSVELMTVSHLNDISFREGAGFGLGFSIVEDIGARGVPGSEGEYGWGGAYHSVYWVDPVEDLVVVFLTQLIPATGSDIRGKLRALIYQAINSSPYVPES